MALFLFILYVASAGEVGALPRPMMHPPRVAPQAQPAFLSRDSRVGINVPNLNQTGSAPIVFVDAAKQAGPWSSTQALKLDLDGNVMALARGQVAQADI